MTKVKICGLRSAEAVAAVSKFPIAYIGFIFAKSRRQVTVEDVASWIQEIGKMRSWKVVGVFVNESVENILEIADQCQLDVVQLNGDETPDDCRILKNHGLQVWKAIGMSETSTSDDHLSEAWTPYVEYVDAFLLDTVSTVGVTGGSGKKFDWKIIPMHQKFAERFQLPMFIAGGLNIENIRELLDDYAPYGVDVSSGVETDGIKDLKKIKQFIERVKGVEDLA